MSKKEFARAFDAAAPAQNFDLPIGFDKLIGLDLVYRADPSIHARMLKKPALHLLLRYRTFRCREGETFGPSSRTKVLMLSNRQMDEYANARLAARPRLAVLPPTISRARRHPEFGADSVRDAFARA